MTLAVCACGGDLKLLVKWEASKDDSGDALRTFLLKCEDCAAEREAIKVSVCSECGASYLKESQAAYCAKADLDPRYENAQLRSGLMSPAWIVKPLGQHA